MAHGVWPKNTIAELVLIGAAGGQQIINIHAFEASAVSEAAFLAAGSVGAADLLADASAQALRDDWITNCLTAYRALHGSLYSLVTVGSQIVERGGIRNHRLGRQDRTNAPLPSAGSVDATSGMLPYQVSGCLRWHSLVASRHARGRSFFGGVAQASEANGVPQQWSATYVAAMNTYATTLEGRYSPTGTFNSWNLTVYSRPYDNPQGNYASRSGGVLHVVDKPDYDGDSNFVTGHYADPIQRTQRRREVGVGA